MYFINEQINDIKNILSSKLNTNISELSLDALDSSNILTWFFNPYYNTTPALFIIPGQCLAEEVSIGETLTKQKFEIDFLLSVNDETTSEKLGLYTQAILETLQGNKNYEFDNLEFYQLENDNTRKWVAIEFYLSGEI